MSQYLDLDLEKLKLYELELALGGELTVEVNENPTTGFKWIIKNQPAEENTETALRLIYDSSHEAITSLVEDGLKGRMDGAVGRGRRRTLKFKAD